MTYATVETQLFARVHHEDWYIDLCSQCFEIAKKNDGKRCTCCQEEIVENGN